MRRAEAKDALGNDTSERFHDDRREFLFRRFSFSPPRIPLSTRDPSTNVSLSEGTYVLDQTLTLKPIGYIATQKPLKFHARHQPLEKEPERNLLELLPHSGYEQALQDLAGFSRIWLIWWFHRNSSWKPLVLPPRGPSKRRGVFATRSPYRPNPLGLTPVQLIAVEGRKLILGACDLVDGTPVLDIKPYIPAYDIFPGEKAGWTDEVEALQQTPPQFAVALSPLAQTQAEWLRANWNIDFRPRMTELLSHDPAPHRTRRIKRRRNGLFEIGCGAWRAVFTVEGKIVNIHALDAAYTKRFLTSSHRTDIPDREAQLAYVEQWPHRAGWDD